MFVVPQQDYQERHGLMIFAPCDKLSCVNITTIDDGCVVEKDETFTVSLELLQPRNDRIRMEPDSGVVTIKDNDGKKPLLKDLAFCFPSHFHQ